MDEKGTFAFRFAHAEELEVIVNAGAGHRTSVVIPREKLVPNAAAEPRPLDSGAYDHSLTVAAQWREQIKDALLGISFLLSIAAFLLSWRTSRRMRQCEKRP